MSLRWERPFSKKAVFFSKMTPSLINPEFCNKKKVLPYKLDIGKTLLMRWFFEIG
jgi:hypothetical protein